MLSPSLVCGSFGGLKLYPQPLGVQNISIFRLIDIEEMGFYLNNCSSNYGRGYSAVRVRVPAHYTRVYLKVNVLLAVEAGNLNLPENSGGSVQCPRCWLRNTFHNYDQMEFSSFCDETCTSLENEPVNGSYDDERVLM